MERALSVVRKLAETVTGEGPDLAAVLEAQAAEASEGRLMRQHLERSLAEVRCTARAVHALQALRRGPAILYRCVACQLASASMIV